MKKSIRAKISNKIQGLTRVQNLTNQKVERKEMELSRFGKGKVFGEVIYVIHEFGKVQPFGVKCISLEAEVLRISAIEFEKKIINSKTVMGIFRKSAIETLQAFQKQKLQRFETHKIIGAK